MKRTNAHVWLTKTIILGGLFALQALADLPTLTPNDLNPPANAECSEKYRFYLNLYYNNVSKATPAELQQWWNWLEQLQNWVKDGCKGDAPLPPHNLPPLPNPIPQPPPEVEHDEIRALKPTKLVGNIGVLAIIDPNKNPFDPGYFVFGPDPLMRFVFCTGNPLGGEVGGNHRGSQDSPPCGPYTGHGNIGIGGAPPPPYHPPLIP